MSDGLERSLCHCLGYMGDILLGSMVISPLLHSMEVSPLSVGVSMGGWGSLGLFVHWLLGSVWPGLDLTSGAGLACSGSFSPSSADLFPETKLEASFSAMSHFALLALTHSSKVLKGINLFFVVLGLTLSSKVLKGIDLLFVSSMVLKESLLVPLLSMVLKEVALLTSCSMSWKETFFLLDLPMVLEEVTLPQFLTVLLTLLTLSSSLMTLMPSTLMVLKEVNLCLSCSLLSCVSLAGVLKEVLVHVHLAIVLKELGGWS